LNIGLGPRDWALFSWPPHYEAVARGMGGDIAHERVIHLVQNTRHANPAFADGYALRLLARPMARIMVAHEVMDAVRPHLNETSASTTIVEAHDWGFFHRVRRGGLPQRLSVGYTTWKSDLGVRVQRRIGERCAFRSIRRTASWDEVRELLHWSDVFLCCPGPQEGFYLPGLEALAAGALVLTPDVGGNRAYCRFGENCLQVGFEDEDSYVAALGELEGYGPERVRKLRDRGYATLEDHRLERERLAFARFLLELSARCGRVAAGRR
jgi:glycosyltransferase involved in cell wall biosynthesis